MSKKTLKFTAMLTSAAVTASVFAAQTSLTASAASLSFKTLLNGTCVNYNGHSYSLVDESLSWEEAESFCKNQGGHLVTIGDEKEQEFIEYLLTKGKKNGYWIGLKNSKSAWSWVDKTKYSYKNWNKGQPDNKAGSEYYGMICGKAKSSFKAGKWNDAGNKGDSKNKDYALSKTGFICEWDGPMLDIVNNEDHSYLAIDASLSWKDAKKFCESLGGHLVTIENKTEQKVVEKLLSTRKKNAYWIGLELVNDKWTWIDKTKFSYSNWNENQPDNLTGDEKYGMIYPADNTYDTWSVKKGTWNDAANKADGTTGDFALSKLGFVCEWDKLKVVPTYYNGSLYALFNKALNWQDSQAYCKKQGGHLVSIGSKGEQKIVEKLVSKKVRDEYWLGLRYVDGKWKWVDGTKYSYTKWNDNQPDNYQGNEFFVIIYSKTTKYTDWTSKVNTWNDRASDANDKNEDYSYVGFVCEWDV